MTRTAVVTGAASGIGLATTRILLRNGCSVVAVDARADPLRSACTELAQSGRVASFVGDISMRETAQGIMKMAEQTFGPVQILVNNAGVSPKIGNRSPRLDEIAIEEWDRTFAVNVTAMLFTCQTFMPGMKEAGWGRVVNVASLAGRTKSILAGPTYSTTKAAVIGFTRTVAAEYAPFGVTVNAVAPGRIDTPMAASTDAQSNARYITQIPAGRMGTPEEVGDAIAFLASENAGFITGVSLDVNGGFFMA